MSGIQKITAITKRARISARISARAKTSPITKEVLETSGVRKLVVEPMETARTKKMLPQGDVVEIGAGEKNSKKISNCGNAASAADCGPEWLN